MPKEIIIDSDNHGVSPKRYLKKTVDLPYYQIIKLLKEKRITLNGKKIKSDTVIKQGDVIKLWLDTIPLREKEKRFVNAKNLEIQKIFENQDFIILNKPPEVVVQGAQDNAKSLSLHLAYLKNLNKDENEFEYVHVHRLDKDTSGILLVAKNLACSRELSKEFRNKEVEKKYLCLVDGIIEKKEGRIEVNLLKKDNELKEKVIISKDGKKTISNYKVLNEYTYEDNELSLVEVHIETGFTHQIRVHMKYLGHPIVCDKMYGNSYINRIFENKLSRQFLHAKSLKFNYKDKEYLFEAKLYEDLENFLRNLKIKK